MSMVVDAYRFGGGGGGGGGVTWNPADKNASIVLSGSDKIASGSAAMGVRATLSKSSGNVQFEVTVNALTDSLLIGLGRAEASLNGGPGDSASGIGLRQDGFIRVVGITSSYVPLGFVEGDVVGVVYNFASGNVNFYRNGVDLGPYAVGWTAGIDLWPMVGGQSDSGAWQATLAAESLAYPVVGATPWGE